MNIQVKMISITLFLIVLFGCIIAAGLQDGKDNEKRFQELMKSCRDMGGTPQVSLAMERWVVTGCKMQ